MKIRVFLAAFAVALVPLCLWFIFAVFALSGEPLVTVQAWIARPINTVLLLCLIGALFHHLQLGMQVVIEDYVHAHAAKFAALLLNTFYTAALGAAAIYAILKMSFGL